LPPTQLHSSEPNVHVVPLPMQAEPLVGSVVGQVAQRHSDIIPTPAQVHSVEP
jgi:hypothetical protein